MDTHVTEWIYRLVDFAIAKEMIEAQDRAFYVNRLLEAMRLDAPEEIDYCLLYTSSSATRPPKEWALISQPDISIRRMNAQISSIYSVTDQGAGGSGLFPWPGKSTA